MTLLERVNTAKGKNGGGSGNEMPMQRVSASKRFSGKCGYPGCNAQTGEPLCRPHFDLVANRLRDRMMAKEIV